jgi:hypothetical protein
MPNVIGQKIYIDIGIKSSSVNEVYNHSTTPTSGNYFRTSSKLIKKQ